MNRGNWRGKGGKQYFGSMSTAWWFLAVPLIALALLVSSQARAQEVEFNLPAQPLESALREFAKQSGLQIAVAPDIVQGKQAPTVTGRLQPDQALQRLLAGSGLIFHREGSTVALSRNVQLPEAELPQVNVHASNDSPARELPKPYAGGQVARGGQLGMLGNRDIMDTPFNQTNYTSRFIQDQQAQSLGDVLDVDPSVYLQTSPGVGIDNFNIRGFVSLNSDIAFGGLYGIAPTSGGMMATESIERIEVLKGPNALLNGIAPAGTIGGTINVIPKRAGDEPLTQFTPSYASDGQIGGHIDVGRRFGPDNSVGLRFNGVYRDGDTAIDGQSQEMQLAALGLDFRGEATRFSVDLGYQYQRTDRPRQDIGLAAGLPVPDEPDSATNYAQQPWTFSEHESLYGSARGEVDLSENLAVFAAIGGQRRLSDAKTVNFLSLQSPQGVFTAALFPLALSTESTTVEAGLKGHATTGPVNHEFVVAGSGYWEEGGVAVGFAPTGGPDIFNPAPVPEPNDIANPEDAPKSSEKENRGFAVADTLSVLEERIQLILGLRWQSVVAKNFDLATGAQTSNYDEDVVTPVVGLVVKPSQNISLYANYVEGLTPGSTAPDTAANAGQVFAPTVTKQYEVGVKVDSGDLGMTFSAFQITQPNAFTDPATNIFAEDGEQRNRGLELTAYGNVTNSVRVLGGVTLIDAELTETEGGVNEGNRPSGVPELRATLAGEWDARFFPGLTLSGKAIYQSSAYLDNANTQEVSDWIRLDIGARYTIERADRSPIIVRATVRNVLGSDYWSVNDSRLGLSEPRTFLLSATFNF